MSEFSEFVGKNRRRCRICAFFDQYPEHASDIRQNMGTQPTKVAAVIADYMIQKFQYHVTPQNVHDHFRRGHEVRREQA